MAIKYSIPVFTCSKPAHTQKKTTLEQRIKYTQVNNKDSRTKPAASIVNSEHILHFILMLSLFNLKKKINGPEKLRFQIINLFSVTVGNILFFGLRKSVGSHVFNLIHPAGIYMFKVNNRNTKIRCEICLKLTIKTPERLYWCCCNVFIANFNHISHLVVVFLLITLSR